MSSSIPLLLRLVSETVTIVTVAGSIARKVLQSGNLAIVDKGKNDLQTIADRAAQLYIVSKLAGSFPKAAIIGEEPGDSLQLGDDFDLDNFIDKGVALTAQESHPFPEILTKKVSEHIESISEDQVVIWVDPLDGTREYTQGLVEHVTVLVGMAVNGTPVGGVIHQPFYQSVGRTIWGIPGIGCGGMNFTRPASGSRIITTTRSHSNPRVEEALAALEPNEVLRVGGAGHKILLLLEGRANAYVYASAGCKKWDTCGPEAILTAAGGQLTDMDGNHYQYHQDVEHLNANGILATAAGEDLSWYLKRIPPK